MEKSEDRTINPVAVAIERVGGPTQAAILLRVSGSTVHRFRAEGRMPTDTAEARERVRTLANVSGVPVVELVGFPMVSDAGRPKPTRRARSSRCLAPLADSAADSAADAAADAQADAEADAFELSSPVETRAAA